MPHPLRLLAPLFALVLLAAAPVRAGVLEVVPVAENVYALVGPLGQRDPDNLGNNATFGAVVTAAGVVLIDPGGSAKGAAMIEQALKMVTDKPVVLVINSGGQDHRWLGNGHFRARGAEIVAAAAAVADQRERAELQLMALGNLVGAEGLAGTEPVTATRVFVARLDLSVGGVRMALRRVGPAHTPGDTIVWLPESRVAFAGDVVYLERLPGVLPVSSSANWLAAFDTLASLDPAVVVPGHGRPAPLARARAETRDYLANLRDRVGAVLDAGGDIHAGTAVDQSAFAGLANFDTLARRNAQAVYMEMEFE